LLWEREEFRMLSFNFGGKNSYDDFGILIAKRPTLPSPKRRINTINIPGRNSNLRFDEKTYEDITLTVECSVKDNLNIADKIDAIKAWLFEAGESDLIFNFQADKKYIAQVVNAIDFSQLYKFFSEFPIIFNCRPFKYVVDNSIITVNSQGIVNNIGTVYAEPKIKVFGSGNIILTIGSQVLQLTGINGHIIIDTFLQDCYDDNGSNLNNKMNGEFPILNVSDNNISWTGAVTKLEVTPNWRWL
jgi:predicted phage tail component-like protein